MLRVQRLEAVALFDRGSAAVSFDLRHSRSDDVERVRMFALRTSEGVNRSWFASSLYLHAIKVICIS